MEKMIKKITVKNKKNAEKFLMALNETAGVEFDDDGNVTEQTLLGFCPLTIGAVGGQGYYIFTERVIKEMRDGIPVEVNGVTMEIGKLKKLKACIYDLVYGSGYLG